MNIEAGKTKIGVVGAGTMGAGIALTALYKGFAIVLYDLYPESLEKGRAYIEKFLAKKNLQNNLDLLTLTGDLEMLADSDFVIEAAIEDLELKQELFANLDSICPIPINPRHQHQHTLSHRHRSRNQHARTRCWHALLQPCTSPPVGRSDPRRYD